MANKVKPIPDGAHTVTPYLTVKGAAQAIEFYKKAFGATELMRMPGPGGAVMHAEIKIGDSLIFLAEEFPGMGNGSPSSLGGTTVGIHLNVENVDAVHDRAVAAGAKSQMPPQDMFWGDRFTKLVDPFGHSWSISTHIEDVSPEEMQRRSVEAMKQMANMKPGNCG
jgi:uncharacterized glyoxalase superfamily protein PhnB